MGKIFLTVELTPIIDIKTDRPNMRKAFIDIRTITEHITKYTKVIRSN